MKTKLTLFLLLLATATFAQTIRRVNNNPGVTGTNIYATIQLAHDAAVNGDIIYVEPSPTEYGGLTSTKQLKIIGPGYYLDPATSQNARTSQPIIFSAGSGGSTLTGLEVNFNGYVQINYVSNITISRCKISFVYLASPNNTQSYSNIVISQSVTAAFSTSAATPPGTVSNIQISNNIITNGPFLSSQYSGNMTNNTILGYNNMTLNNFSISNNIWSKNNLSYSFSGSNNTVFNNVASESQFGTGNNNLANVNMLNVFVVDPTISTPSGYTGDSRYQIKAGSPTIGAGFNSTDCGAFAGSTSYILSGIPPYPSISKFLNSSTGSSTAPLSVTISTKSNN